MPTKVRDPPDGVKAAADELLAGSGLNLHPDSNRHHGKHIDILRCAT